MYSNTPQKQRLNYKKAVKGFNEKELIWTDYKEHRIAQSNIYTIQIFELLRLKYLSKQIW